MRSFGTDEYGNKNGFKVICQRCGREAQVIPTHYLENGKTIKDVLKENIAIIIGNEGSGVRKEILDLCDFSINLKMNAGCESLNAGVCASIIMYEVNNG